MTKDTKLSELIINKLTTAQYDGITTKDPNQIYIVTDALGFDNTLTNCLTHIPQDIKLELVDGTLTLKAGSKVWIPYGTTEAYQIGDTDAYGNTVVETSWDSSKFFYAIELQSDLTKGTVASYTGPITVYITSTNNLFRLYASGVDSSGTTIPTTSANFYNTDTNFVNRYNQGSIDTASLSFPIARITITNGVVTSLDQVFNSFGYIGSTFFALTGFEYLISKGKLANGIDNYKFVNNKVFTGGLYTGDSLKRTIIAFVKNNELTLNLGTTYLGGANHVLSANYIESPVNPKISDNALWFNTNDYKFYFNNKNNVDSPVECLPVIFALNSVGNKSNTLSFCDFKTTFHAVDYDDAVLKYGDQEIDGTKTFKKAPILQNEQFDSRIVTENSFNVGDLVTSNIFNGFKGVDANGQEFANCNCAYSTAGRVGCNFYVVREDSGSTVSGILGVFIDKDGTSAYTQAPTPATGDNSTKIATTAWVRNQLSSSGNGLATISKAQNGYCKFSNGLIIQWGSSAKGNNLVITFPTAFTSTNYSVSANSTSMSAECYARNINSKTTTGFTMYVGGGANQYAWNWIAIGY